MKLAADWLDRSRPLRLSPHSVPSPFHHPLGGKPGTPERREWAAFVERLTQALA